MKIQAEPFPSLAARNRLFERIRCSILLCETTDELDQLREEYRDDLTKLKADQDSHTGFNLHQALQDAFHERAQFLTHETEFHQCLYNLPHRKSES